MSQRRRKRTDPVLKNQSTIQQDVRDRDMVQTRSGSSGTGETSQIVQQRRLILRQRERIRKYRIEITMLKRFLVERQNRVDEEQEILQKHFRDQHDILEVLNDQVGDLIHQLGQVQDRVEQRIAQALREQQHQHQREVRDMRRIIQDQQSQIEQLKLEIEEYSYQQ
ncbi:hypothetical protein INT45_007989 [Circinella minor]|uniref:Uncharacterized protein n=1 Tax=Circinella minor TaxID=1195481 RepID=A0A8H7S5Z3_9FUNG|nr:hypothetical protein INT45_007989 [Circinella minor]